MGGNCRERSVGGGVIDVVVPRWIDGLAGKRVVGLSWSTYTGVWC